MEKIIISNVAVPIGEKPGSVHFIAPDLEPTLKYYPQFLKSAKKILSPIRYINAVLNVCAKTGEHREKLLNEYARWSGDFPQWLKQNNALYRQSTEYKQSLVGKFFRLRSKSLYRKVYIFIRGLNEQNAFQAIQFETDGGQIKIHADCLHFHDFSEYDQVTEEEFIKAWDEVKITINGVDFSATLS